MDETERQADETTPAEPEPPKNYTVLVELFDDGDKGRRLVKFAEEGDKSAFHAALDHPVVPPSSRIWVTRGQFLDNSRWADYDDVMPEEPDKHPAGENRERKMLLWDKLLELALTPEQAVERYGVSSTKEGKMPRKAKDPKAPKAPREKTGPRTRMDPKTKIIVKADKNPAREGTETHARFALIKSGMTVGTYVEKGGKATYLTYFEKGGHIELQPPA